MGNSVILTLADGGDANNRNYGKYLQLEKSSPFAYYNRDFGQIANANMIESFGLQYQLVDFTSVYVIREKGGKKGKGFVMRNDSERARAQVITNLIKKQSLNNNDQLLIIAHHGIDKTVLPIQNCMIYRTGGGAGDVGTECEWEIVCNIVDACLSQEKTLSFEQIKEKIEHCTIKKKLRIIIHKLELLIAPLNIECEGKDGQSVNIDNEINQQISCLVAGESCDTETEKFLNRCCGGKSLKQLLEEGKYLSNDEILNVVEQLNVIPTGTQETAHVRNICKEFYKNLQFISKKVFFEKRQGDLP